LEQNLKNNVNGLNLSGQNKSIMNSFANILKELRVSYGMNIHDVALSCRIDASLYSKYEHGTRLPSDKHLILLGDLFDNEKVRLREYFLAEKIAKLIPYDISYEDVFKVAESRVAYLRSSSALTLPSMDANTLADLEVLTRLRDQWQTHKPLNKLQLEKLYGFFNTQYTFDSNRIEGNTLTFQETHLVVNEGITISGKSMREHLEAINHNEAVDFVVDLVRRKEPFTERVLLELHSLILKSIDSSNAGRYRTVAVRISGSAHIPPDPLHLPELMSAYFDHYNQQKYVLHPVILAAEMHERLVSIHPFVDGNGRTSRLVMNLILLSNGYTVTSLKGDHTSRMTYYRALEEVQVNNEPIHFYRLIIEHAKKSLEEHLELT